MKPSRKRTTLPLHKRYRQLELQALEERRLLATFAVCDAAGLISAVAQANSNSDASNTIDLASGDYQVNNLTISNQNGARTRTSSETLTIVGAGQALGWTVRKPTVHRPVAARERRWAGAFAGDRARQH